MRPLDPRLLREASAARRFVVGAGALALLSAAATIAQAALLAHVVVASFLHGRSLRSVAPELAALGALACVRGGIAWTFESGGRLTALAVTRDLRARLLAHVVGARPGGVHDLAPGEVATAATEGARALEPYFARFLPQLLVASVVPPAILVWTALHDATSAAIMLVTLPLIPGFGILIGRAAQHRTLARWEALARMSAHFLDVVRGLTTLRAYRRGAVQADTIAAVTDEYRRETMGTLRVAFLSALVLELAATLGTAVIAVEIGVRLVAGSVALEPALAVLVLAPELYGPLRQVSAQFHASADGVAAAQRIFALLDLAPTVVLPASPVTPPDLRFVPLELRHAAVAYPGRGEVLHDVTLTLRPGERVAVVGPSGAGKSTLLALLLRFVEPTRGRVLAGAVDVASTDDGEWRRLVAWLPQRPRLEPGLVDDAIRAGGGADPRDAAFCRDLLGRTVGEDGAGLSAGQVRRVALARALLRDAPLLLLDEPTAHLDAETAATVAEAIRRIPRTRTVVVATHDPALLSSVDRVLELDRGVLRALPARSAA